MYQFTVCCRMFNRSSNTRQVTTSSYVPHMDALYIKKIKNLLPLT